MPQDTASAPHDTASGSRGSAPEPTGSAAEPPPPQPTGSERQGTERTTK
jgi:hypothetical protein